MSEAPGSIERELIRHRLEKRMAGRRDLLLHFIVYIAIAVIYWTNTTWYRVDDLIILGTLWSMPLVLHGLRYYYRCGPGAIARADEIESAIELAAGGSALDEEEEMLIEERAVKRINARRVVAAHFVTASILVALLLGLVWLNPDQPYSNADRLNVSTYFALAFALHSVRFFFVHGRTPAGRALKIEGEIEREWHQSRQRREDANEGAVALRDLGELSGRRVRLNPEGELENGADLAHASARQGSARRAR